MSGLPLPDITKLVYEAKEKERKIYPCHSNRASEMGHPCERYLVYNRLNWNDKIIPSVETQFIFDAGNIIEKLAKEDLEKAGFEIIEMHRPYEWKEYEITGYIDFMLRSKDGFEFPVEVKGLQNYDVQKLDCIEDFLGSRKIWLKKYPAQLTLYMLMANKEYGAFYIKSKPSMKPKHIWINIDYTFGEELLQKAQRVNICVKNKTYPERIEYEGYICDKCPYAHICLPEVKNVGAKLINSPELEEKLERREELKDSVEEYEAIDKEIKDAFREIPEAFVGKNWQIIGKWREMNKIDTKALPEEIKKQYTITSKSWITTIMKI